MADTLDPGPQGMLDPTPMGPPSSLEAGGSLAPGGADLQKRRDIAMMDQEIAAAQKNLAQIGPNAQAKANALRPLREAQLAELSKPLPQPPQPKPLPSPPDPNQQSGNQAYLTAAMFLGTLAGALTRRPITNALAGFTGAVQGFEQGNKDAFDRGMKVWEAETKKAIEANKEANDAYMRILKSRELSIEQKSLMIQVKAAEYDDMGLAQLTEAKQHEAIAQLIDTRIRYGDQMSKSLNGGRDEMLKMMAEKEVASHPDAARAIAEYRQAPPSPNARTGYIGFYNNALMDAVRQINPQYDMKEYGNRVAAGKVEATIDPMTARRTSIAFATGTQGNAVRSINVAEDHLQALGHLTTAMQNGDINAINQMKNYIQSELGVAAPTNFQAAKQIIAQEIVKAVIATGGGVTERQEAASYINSARSPEQITGLISVYQRLMAGQMSGLRRQYEGGTGRKDFDQRYVEPETARQLESLRSEGIPTPPNEIRSLTNRIAKATQGMAGEAIKDVGAGIATGAEKAQQGINWLLTREDELGAPQLRQLRPEASRPPLPAGMPPELQRLYQGGYKIEPMPSSPDMPIMQPGQ